MFNGIIPKNSLFRVTTFLEFLETWKCCGIRVRSVTSEERGPKSGKGHGICVVE